jgi:hypothetical protein
MHCSNVQYHSIRTGKVGQGLPLPPACPTDSFCAYSCCSPLENTMSLQGNWHPQVWSDATFVMYLAICRYVFVH